VRRTRLLTAAGMLLLLGAGRAQTVSFRPGAAPESETWIIAAPGGASVALAIDREGRDRVRQHAAEWGARPG
jgi:hypothetical protein